MGICLSSSDSHQPSAASQARTHKGRLSAAECSECISREQFILKRTGCIADLYDLDSKYVGQGTFGTVFPGVHKATGSTRAVKVISREHVCDVDAFRREICIMKMLDHPNIIRLFETFEDKRNVYLSMELCSGGELFDHVIAAGSLTEKETAHVLQNIISAVYYMHQRDMAHRDCKPENFLLANKGPIVKNVLKIIDFGTACRCGPFTTMSTLVGTRYYVAPQVLSRRYDRKCDVWSCGAIMYTLLCGHPPFGGRNDREVLQKVRAGNYSLEGKAWINVSEDAKNLIRMMMNFTPRARYTAQQALNHVWIRQQAPRAQAAPLQDELVQNLRGFHSENRLKKAALQIIAGHLDEGQTKRLREAFLALDSNGDGMLTLDELRQGLTKAGLQDMKADLEHVVKGIDVDCSGAIDYTEFIAASLNRSEAGSREACIQAFSVFDLDGDGKITREELTTVLDRGRPRVSSAELLLSLDSDGDGTINFNEFMAMMNTITVDPNISDAETDPGSKHSGGAAADDASVDTSSFESAFRAGA